ncbi:glycoside hydrolase family 48 protein [Crossiella sp. CA-258035]|uniref:glycoside hydrolase family 48 protein n=1 Tax=Crossiella sp. CA-258035 TaxID=2981138 RepID=UPI0024BCBC7D|nr:glycoside hydrolase family 48 protein [Crossiella sp. CA-258035]WHT22699.1 glycoside hydrolase family 48 protein [Crossiella sp. CA-258035]
MRSRALSRRWRAGPLPAALATALAGAVTLPLGALPAAAAPSVACTVVYQVTNEWSTGFSAAATIRNEGEALNGWKLTWTFADGQKVSNGWNGVFTQQGAAVTVANPDWARVLPAGGSTQVNFNAEKGAANRPPTDFAVNGVRCTGANRAPSVALTSPADGSTFTAPASIALAAEAADTDGTVSKVEFFAGTTPVGTATAAPWRVNWTGATAGEYSVTARATDDKGATTVSNPVAVRVLGAPAVLATPGAVSVRQGDSVKVGVKLASAPAGEVTATVTRTGSADLTATPATLRFTPQNYNTAQQLTIAAADNGGALGEARFTVSAAGHTAATITAKELGKDTSSYAAAFLAQYNKIKDPAAGYFRRFGELLVPYHSVETLVVEAPDHGHQTTSEAFSYYLWLEASYGRVTKDWAPLAKAWESLEKFIIPGSKDQPTNSFYNPAKPATYAPEHPHPRGYPSQLDPGVAVGQDPLATELRSAYGNNDIYGMHWLLDVDNTYGYGHCGDGTNNAPAYVNTFQRGEQESVWETVTHPSCDTFKHGGRNGFLDLFTKDANYAKQWRYTNAPDADARAVQVAYWAKTWAEAQGKGAEVAPILAKAAKMGDYLRYAMFDKYFKKIGNCVGPASCPAGTGKNSAHYLMGWYYSWGGATDTSAGWSWRIGSSAPHQGYQNPLAAWALANDPALKPKSATGQQDWDTSYDRQLEFLQWLQASNGGIAGGASNSWGGSYQPPPAGSAKFHGMAYDFQPVWHDPPSNRWFGFQVWGVERIAQLYHVTKDARAKAILDKWVPWAIANTTAGNGSFKVPSDLEWTGKPDDWTGTPTGNPGLTVKVLNHSQDVGVAAALSKTLLYYAAASGNTAARTTGERLLDALLAHQDGKGIAVPETRADYSRFDDKLTTANGDGLYIPPGWTGTMANGDRIDANSTFLSIRSFYKNDPDWPKVQAYLDGGPAPTLTIHRFWSQAEIATAFAAHSELFGG